MLKNKVMFALKNNLTVVYCVGENQNRKKKQKNFYYSQKSNNKSIRETI